jgi:hypothetical protein
MRSFVGILVLSLAVGCGKKRIIEESNHIQGLASGSLNLANEIVRASEDPEIVTKAGQIAENQQEILTRSRKISLATADIEDRAEGFSAWWGDFFLGSVENVKWVVLAVVIGVVAFVGYRARVWSLLGSLLRPFRSGSS